MSLYRYLIPLSKIYVLLSHNTEKPARLYTGQAQNYKYYLSALIQCSTRELSYERQLQELYFKKVIPDFIQTSCLLIAKHWMHDLSLETKEQIVSFFQANAIKKHFSQIDAQHGFFHKLKRREALGEGKLQVMLQIQALPFEDITHKCIEYLAAELQRNIDNEEIFLSMNFASFIQNIKKSTLCIQNENEQCEQGFRQQLTSFDEASYYLYKIIANNRFFHTGRSLFLATEQASRDERFKNIPGNVHLDAEFVAFFSVIAGTMYLYSTISQFTIWGTIVLSGVTQSTTDLEFLTWVGSKMSLSSEKTLRAINFKDYGISIKDIAQFVVIVLQVLMELGDQNNATLMRAILGSILVLSLAGSAAGFVSGKFDKFQNSKLTPMVSLCSFFAAARLISCGFNLMTNGVMYLYHSYDLYYGTRTPEEILMDPVLCGIRPEACKREALSFFKLPIDASHTDIKSAYKQRVVECHPDVAVGDKDCLLKARVAREILK